MSQSVIFSKHNVIMADNIVRLKRYIQPFFCGLYEEGMIFRCEETRVPFGIRRTENYFFCRKSDTGSGPYVSTHLSQNLRDTLSTFIVWIGDSFLILLNRSVMKNRWKFCLALLGKGPNMLMESYCSGSSIGRTSCILLPASVVNAILHVVRSIGLCCALLY